MSDIRERRVGRLLLRIDRHLCVGFGDCADEAPETFELDEDGIAVIKDGVDGIPQERLVQACRSCPVDALTLLDEAGGQLAP